MFLYGYVDMCAGGRERGRGEGKNEKVKVTYGRAWEGGIACFQYCFCSFYVKSKIILKYSFKKIPHIFVHFSC